MMTDETVIAHLEELRTSIAQRQRAATALGKTFKGLNDALSKASRSLGDYAEGAPGADEAKLSAARAAFSALRLREDAVDPLAAEARREIKTLTAVGTALKDASIALRGSSVDVVKLDHALTALGSSPLADERLAALRMQLRRELSEAQRLLGATFGEALRETLREQGVEVSGQSPRFAAGSFEIVADFGARAASISYGKDVVIPRVPLAVQGVGAAYARSVKAVAGRTVEGASWMEQLYSAWETVRARRTTPSPRANIVECYFEMSLLRQSRAFRTEPVKSRLTDYTRAQFSYDFTRFVLRERLTHKGLHVIDHGAVKAQAEGPERSVWILRGESPYDGSYVGDLEFGD